jgi:hypothetical protein
VRRKDDQASIALLDRPGEIERCDGFPLDVPIADHDEVAGGRLGLGERSVVVEALLESLALLGGIARGALG